MITRHYLLPTVLALVLFGSAPAQAQGLNAYIASSTDAPGPGDAIDYTLMVSNSGDAVLENVNLDVILPDQIVAFGEGSVVGNGFECFGSAFCGPGETEAWPVGTLAPGENLYLTYPTYIAANPPSGDAMTTIVASADNVSDVILIHAAAVDPSPLLRLSLVPGPGPAVPGEPFTYALTYGNVGSTAPSAVTVTMDVPDGAEFVSATGGGVESGGTVTWSLGEVGVGAGGRVELTVVPDPGLATGATLEAEAAIDSGIVTELVVRSQAVTEVGLRETLRFDHSVSQNAVGRGGGLYYTLTATNVGTANDLANVTVEVRLPDEIVAFGEGNVVGDDFECFGSAFCGPGETEAWLVGTLAPGQSRTIVMYTSINAAAQQGEVPRTLYYATADGLNEQSGGDDLVVDSSPVSSLRLVPGPGPAAPGEPFTYTLLFSNIGFQPNDVILRMTLPEGTTFASATGNGTETDGVVTWLAPNLPVEAVGRFEVTVEVDESMPAGSQLEASAVLDTGSPTEYVLHATVSSPVRGDVRLKITYTSDIEAGRPGDPVNLTMTAENLGTSDLTDIVAEVRLPDQIVAFGEGSVVGNGFECFGSAFCGPGETEAWLISQLAPGQTRTIVLPTSIASGASEGTFLLSPVVAKATGSNEVVLALDVLLGEPFEVSNEEGSAETVALGVEAYPTPFAGATTFALSLPAEGEVRLVVYDVLGRAVGTLIEGSQASGEHTVQWNALGLPSGVYFFRLETAQGTRTGSVVKVE